MLHRKQMKAHSASGALCSFVWGGGVEGTYRWSAISRNAPLDGQLKGGYNVSGFYSVQQHHMLPQKIPVKSFESCLAVSDTVSRRGYKPSSGSLSRLALREQREASVTSTSLSGSLFVTLPLSVSLAGCLFLITCPSLYEDQNVGLASISDPSAFRRLPHKSPQWHNSHCITHWIMSVAASPLEEESVIK